MRAGKQVSGEAGKYSGSAGSSECWNGLRLMLVLVALASPLPRFLASPLQAQTSLTIYNDGRVLVRRSVSATLPKGSSTQRVTLGALDPATIFSLDSSVDLERVSYDGAVDEASVLRRSVGKRLVFRLSNPRDTVSALVLGVDPLRLQLPDGRVSFSPPGMPVYPSELVVVDPTVSLAVRSERSLDRIRLGYFTSGASWQASYQVVLGRQDARVTGMAVLPSESLRAEDAEIHLLAGSVGQAQPPPGAPRPMMRKEALAAADVAESRRATEQRVGESSSSKPSTVRLLAAPGGRSPRFAVSGRMR